MMAMMLSDLHITPKNLIGIGKFQKKTQMYINQIKIKTWNY